MTAIIAVIFRLCPLARKEIKRSGFPASATGWREFLKRDNANSHSAGFLCGMTIRVGQQKSETQTVAMQASKILVADGFLIACGNADWQSAV